MELSIIERLEYGITQHQEELDKPEIKYPKSLEMDKLYLTGKKELLHLEGWMKETGIFKRYLFEFVFKIVFSLLAHSALVTSSHKHWDVVFGLLALCSLLHVLKSLYFYTRTTTQDVHSAIREILLLEGIYFSCYSLAFASVASHFLTKRFAFVTVLSSIPLLVFSFYLLQKKHEKFSYSVFLFLWVGEKGLLHLRGPPGDANNPQAHRPASELVPGVLPSNDLLHLHGDPGRCALHDCDNHLLL